LENTYAALEAGLHRIDFFKVRAPEAIMRTLRTVISRAEPDLQEAGLLRAIGFEIGYHLDRLQKRTAPPETPDAEDPSNRQGGSPSP
jgi:tRNA C32,U32 (ribose-2'-O)-methylase TrmJ